MCQERRRRHPQRDSTDNDCLGEERNPQGCQQCGEPLYVPTLRRELTCRKATKGLKTIIIPTFSSETEARKGLCFYSAQMCRICAENSLKDKRRIPRNKLKTLARKITGKREKFKKTTRNRKKDTQKNMIIMNESKPLYHSVLHKKISHHSVEFCEIFVHP